MLSLWRERGGRVADRVRNVQHTLQQEAEQRADLAEAAIAAEQERAAEFGWLYGMIPVAPTVYIFAEMYEIHADFTAVMYVACNPYYLEVYGIVLPSCISWESVSPFDLLPLVTTTVGAPSASSWRDPSWR